MQFWPHSRKSFTNITYKSTYDTKIKKTKLKRLVIMCVRWNGSLKMYDECFRFTLGLFFMILDFIAIFFLTRMFIDTYDDQFSLNYVIKAYPSSLEELSWEYKKGSWYMSIGREKKDEVGRQRSSLELLKSLNLSASSGTMMLSMRMWIA